MKWEEVNGAKSVGQCGQWWRNSSRIGTPLSRACSSRKQKSKVKKTPLNSLVGDDSKSPLAVWVHIQVQIPLFVRLGTAPGCVARLVIG